MFYSVVCFLKFCCSFSYLFYYWRCGIKVINLHCEIIYFSLCLRFCFMYSGTLLLATHVFITIIPYWWIHKFRNNRVSYTLVTHMFITIIPYWYFYNCPCLSLETATTFKSSSLIIYLLQFFFWLLFAYEIFIHPFTFKLFMHLISNVYPMK